MEPWSAEPAGRFEETTFESEALRGNPLGDPTERPLWVYVPPGYDDEPDRRYPTVYVIQGLTGQLDMWRNRPRSAGTSPSWPTRCSPRGDAPPAIVVWVDCWTSLGGSQFLDSPGTGRYHTYLCDEIVPWVDANYRTLADRDHRGIKGKSSGGYGAMVTPMLRPDLLGGLATHAGDALFEVVLPAGVPRGRARAARRLRRLVRPLLGGLPQPSGLLEGQRRHAAERLVHGGVLLGRPRRHGPAARSTRPPGS